MCRKVLEEVRPRARRADGAGSHMPLARRASNLAFAILLGHLSRKR
jgi:hypothetical protein